MKSNRAWTVESVDICREARRRADTFSSGCDLSSVKFFLHSITSHDLDLNLTLAGLLRIAWTDTNGTASC